MACAICETRRPRRFCPAVRGEICTLCCGTGREITIDCPFSCEYLREAHSHEKPNPIDPATLPNRDITVSEDFLQENEPFLIFLGTALAEAAMRTPEVVDFDIREALDSLIRTYRTLQSGLLYESLPANPLAAGLCRALQQTISDFREEEADRSGIHKSLETITLSVLVFLQHFELSYNNGRRRGRAFIDALMDFYPVGSDDDPSTPSSLLLP